MAKWGKDAGPVAVEFFGGPFDGDVFRAGSAAELRPRLERLPMTPTRALVAVYELAHFPETNERRYYFRGYRET